MSAGAWGAGCWPPWSRPSAPAYGRAVLIWVLAANAPARAFYEALGGRYLREQQIEIGGVALPEVAYGWPDAAALARPG